MPSALRSTAIIGTLARRGPAVQRSLASLLAFVERHQGELGENRERVAVRLKAMATAIDNTIGKLEGETSGTRCPKFLERD